MKHALAFAFVIGSLAQAARAETRQPASTQVAAAPSAPTEPGSEDSEAPATARIVITKPPTAAALTVDYQRVGRDLMKLRTQHGGRECGDLQPRFRAIKLDRAVATPATRIAAAITLAELAMALEQLRGAELDGACLDNSVAASATPAVAAPAPGSAASPATPVIATPATDTAAAAPAVAPAMPAMATPATDAAAAAAPAVAAATPAGVPATPAVVAPATPAVAASATSTPTDEPASDETITEAPIAPMIVIAKPPTAAALTVEYQRVGRDLQKLRAQRGDRECGDLLPRFRAIKLPLAVVTPATRAAAAVTLAELALRIERLRGIQLDQACLDNPLAATCQ